MWNVQEALIAIAQRRYKGINDARVSMRESDPARRSALAVSEASKRTMKKFSLFSVSVTTLALVGPAVGQYVPPPPGVWINPTPAPGTMPPGYKWREQRPYEDPRRNSNIPQDRQPRENYETPSTLNNATGRGTITDPGECAIGVSEETCRRRGQKYNPPKN